jgi:hypothetical protein
MSHALLAEIIKELVGNPEKVGVEVIVQDINNNKELTEEEIQEQTVTRLLRMYNKIQEHPTSHPSSWTHRGIKTGYDGKGCNQFTGCVPECSFYPPMKGIGQKRRDGILHSSSLGL